MIQPALSPNPLTQFIGHTLFRARQPRHKSLCDNKANETRKQPLPIAAGNKVEASQGDAHPREQADEEPKRRLFGRNALAYGPPEATEEDRTEQSS
jgi:hypothetical protein